MTCVAVMVVPLVVPSTRTLSPFVMALAEVELVPFWYVVEDASLTVTFWPVAVDIVKPAVDTLPTVPDAPPAAGPDRALDPPPPAAPPASPGRPDVAEDAGAAAEEAAAAVEEVAVGEDVAVGDADDAQPAASAITAAATIHRPLLFDSNRRTFRRCVCSAVLAATVESGE